MSNEEVKKQQTMYVKPVKVREAIFGDIIMTLWRDYNGNMRVTMKRGKPEEKTFCLEHFLEFARKVQLISDQIEGL